MFGFLKRLFRREPKKVEVTANINVHITGLQSSQGGFDSYSLSSQQSPSSGGSRDVRSAEPDIGADFFTDTKAPENDFGEEVK